MSQKPGQSPNQNTGQAASQNTGQAPSQNTGENYVTHFIRKATNKEALKYDFVGARKNIKTTKFLVGSYEIYGLTRRGGFLSATASAHHQHLSRMRFKFSTDINFMCHAEYTITAYQPAKRADYGNMCCNLGSIGLTLKACLGGGVVAIHESYKECGLWTSIFLNVALGFAVGYCMYELTHSAQLMYGRVQKPSMTYPDLAEASLALGPWEKWKKYDKKFRYFVDAIVIIDFFGSCCVYQVVVARTIKQLVDGTASVDDNIPPSIRIYIALLTIPIMALCMIKSFAYLAPFSLVADFFILIIVGATIYYGIQANTTNAGDMPAFNNVSGLLTFIGVCVFGMEGVGAVLTVENHMANPRQMGMVISLGMVIVIALMSLVGFFGYWGFGEDAVSPVTLNYPFSLFSIILKVGMAFMIYITYILSFWIPFDLVWHYVKRRYDRNQHSFWERVYRAIFVLMDTAIATALPNVSNFIGLLGSFCLSMLGFVFPAFIELAIVWEEPGLGTMKWRLIKAIVIMVFGFLMCILGTYSNFKELIHDLYIDNKLI